MLRTFQPLKLKANHAFTELGKAVFEKHGAESGPEEVVRPVLDCRARLAKLDLEIGQLSQSPKGQVITPKRMTVAGLVVVALLTLFLAHWAFFGTRHAPSQESASERIVGTWSRKVRVESGISSRTATVTDDVCSIRLTSGGSASDKLWWPRTSDGILIRRQLLVVSS